MIENRAKFWQSVLRRHFPGVIVGRYLFLDDEDIEMYNVYCVPDGRKREFFKFQVDGGPWQYLREGDMDPPSFDDYDCSETKEFYPAVWQMHLDELAQRGRGKAKVARKSNGSKQRAAERAVARKQGARR